MTPKKVVDPDAPDAAGGGGSSAYSQSADLPSAVQSADQPTTQTETKASESGSEESLPPPGEVYVTQADMSMMMDDIQNRFEVQQQVFSQQQSAILFKMEEFIATVTANQRNPAAVPQQPSRTNPMLSPRTPGPWRRTR